MALWGFTLFLAGDDQADQVSDGFEIGPGFTQQRVVGVVHFGACVCAVHIFTFVQILSVYSQAKVDDLH